LLMRLWLCQKNQNCIRKSEERCKSLMGYEH
jgi:hypothetical protein